MELFRMAVVLPVLMLFQDICHPFRLSQHCSGVVEVLYQGVWRPVMFDNASAEWTNAVNNICANQSCGAVYTFGHNGNATLNYNSSTCLSQCVYSDLLVENCTELSHTECSNLTEITCGHQLVRLVGGAGHCEGRVELWKEGHWGTVCDDSWDLKDGSVVCAQLDCGPALNVSGEGWSFKAGTGLIFLDEVNCNGSERNLWECPSQGIPNDCGHKEDAAVVCSGFQVNQTGIENTQVSTTGSVPNVTSKESLSSPISAAVWGCIALSTALLLTLLSNALLFQSYKGRAALVVYQSQDSQLLSIQSQPTQRDEGVNLLTVTTETGVHKSSLKSASISSGECYEDIETLDNELLFSGPTEPFLPDCVRKQSLGSSSTSSGECYENLTLADEENLHSANPYQSSPVQSTSTHQDQQQPEDSCCHQLRNQNQVSSLKSASISSGECYENIETLDNELLLSGPSEPFLPDCVRKQSLGSSSTSSGECYENLTLADEENLHSANPYQSSPVQSTSTHQDQQQPEDSCCHQLSNQSQDDSSSSSSSELYENIEVNNEEDVCAATVKEDPDQSLSDSDYDDITTY
ncbi:scavenger receptor cysteine-rich type 1 protein M130-like isoform X2 [Esox lucius]|uniref:SRCR domain-containing protein n=1 Tax=Esox lucius TaxID=8010 RepID=A0A6Q2YTY8_ESOLU|nr:scavenger receptor cysteine-rich type 1 protein M130-like isoform X2 [Esox lucius]